MSCTQKDDSNSITAVNSPEKTLKNDLQKYPDSLPLRLKLIQLYTDSNNFKQAIKLADEALAKDSLNPELWDIKASVLYQSEDTLGAVHAFEKAIAIIPLPDYLISLGSLYAQTKNPKALNIADELIADRNSKADKEAIFIKGLYYSYIGDKIRSIDYFNQCIKLDYTYMFAYREKAICLFDMAKYREAIDVLTRAVTLQNSFDEGYYWLGRCEEKLNLIEEAINNYKTALMYDKNFVEARDALNRIQKK
ncbi:MAG: hypothetical protein NVSMB45_13850 [Ginsengibacter sp.]